MGGLAHLLIWKTCSVPVQFSGGIAPYGGAPVHDARDRPGTKPAFGDFQTLWKFGDQNTQLFFPNRIWGTAELCCSS